MEHDDAPDPKAALRKSVFEPRFHNFGRLRAFNKLLAHDDVTDEASLYGTSWRTARRCMRVPAGSVVWKGSVL
jgi:hypothetical protein